MNCIVTKVLSEPQKGIFGGFIVKVEYKIADKILETVLCFDYIEEAELVEVGFEFEV